MEIFTIENNELNSNLLIIFSTIYFCLTIIDNYLGVLASKVNNEQITSKRYRGTLLKIILLFIIIVTFYIAMHEIGGYIITVSIVLIGLKSFKYELISIQENNKRCFGTELPFINALIEILNLYSEEYIKKIKNNKKNKDEDKQ